MPIIASDKPTTPGIEPGSYNAVCTAVVELGSQINQNYPDKGPQPKVAIRWEIPDERIEIDGKSVPRRMIKTYTLSLGKKASLRRDLEGWRGRAFTEEELRGFDLANVIAKGCMLTITLNEKGKTVVSGVSKVPKGMNAATPEAAPVYWCIADSNGVLPPDLPEFVLTEIKKSPEWEKVAKPQPDPAPTFTPGGGAKSDEGTDEDVPF